MVIACKENTQLHFTDLLKEVKYIKKSYVHAKYSALKMCFENVQVNDWMESTE